MLLSTQQAASEKAHSVEDSSGGSSLADCPHPQCHAVSDKASASLPGPVCHPSAPKAMRMTHSGTPRFQVFDMCPDLAIAWRSRVICSYSELLPAWPLVRALRASSPFFSIWLQVSWQLSWPQHSSLFKRLRGATAGKI